MEKRKKLLILGAKGMLGHTLLRTVVKYYGDYEAYGSIRDNDKSPFSAEQQKNIISGIDVLNYAGLSDLIGEIKPDIIVNCIGIIKQLKEAKDPILSFEINSLLPHKLLKICEKVNARLICMSTDCVFDGAKGNYTEEDNPNPIDLYGRSKLLGEISYSPGCFTIRSSIIGHELHTKNGLLEWFLAQTGKANGYTHAMYSGFTTFELAKMMVEKIFTNKALSGMMQIASQPISKFDLLKIIAKVYNKDIEVIPFDDFYCNRVLAGTKFNKLVNYTPPSWETMIQEYYKFHKHEYI